MSSVESGFEDCRILVTGASGFIGHHLVRNLLDDSPTEVRVLVREASPREQLESWGVSFTEGDLKDPESLAKAVDGIDVVFHVAGLTRARSRSEFLEINAVGTGMLARAARASETVSRFVYLSSLAATGPVRTGDSVDETTPERPLNDYGLSKIEGERALKREAEDQLAFTILRPPPVYGPGERDLFTMFRMVKRGFAPILGFRDKFYSFVFVDDLVGAMRVAALSPKAEGETYFVADPRVYSTAELLSCIEEGLGKRAMKPRLPHALGWFMGGCNSIFAFACGRRPLLDLRRMRELACRRWVCDVKKFYEQTGYECSTTLQKGVDETAGWYLHRGWL